MNYLANSSVAFVLRRYLRSLMFFLRRHYIHQWAVERVYSNRDQSRVATKKNLISILYWHESAIYMYIVYIYTYIYIFFSRSAYFVLFIRAQTFARPVLRAACDFFFFFVCFNTFFLSLFLFCFPRNRDISFCANPSLLRSPIYTLFT